MKKQALAIAIAAALVAPSAFAAQDTSGMQFTSASEGFYASLRARLDFSGDRDQTAHLDGNSSRIGVRGSNDLGGGLSGFYQWELGVNIGQGSSAGSTRLGHVGLRGDFGEFVAGSFWSNDYNWVHGSTDVANNYSGFLIYNADREARATNSLQYTTPDLNGFQGALRFRLNGGAGYDSDLSDDANDLVIEQDNDLDAWNISGQYAIQGFTVAGTYQSRADGQTGAAANTLEDLNTWAIRLGYAQDNWYVNGWYGERNHSDGPTGQDDSDTFSIAGGVAIDKVNLYGVYETQENGTSTPRGDESNYGTLGVQYNLGAQSRVWIEYFSQDIDGANSGNYEDIISVGLRHDF